MSFETVLWNLASGEKKNCKDLGIEPGELDQIYNRIIGLQIECSREGETLCIPGGLDLLSADKIRDLITAGAREMLAAIEIFMEIDSTNSYLFKQELTTGRGILVLAEHQTAGRGRRGRSWVSPFGTNLYMSLLWRMPLARASIEGLSLAVGLAVIKGLEEQGFPGIKMKWPNDLLLHGAKVAGILIELKPPTAGYVDLVVGIGVNLKMPTASGQLIDQPWQDLSVGMQGKSRNVIAASIVTSLIGVLQKFADTGFAAFQQEWEAKDSYSNMPVELHMGDSVVTGIAMGVNELGAVRVLVDEEIREFHGGEITLRSAHDS